MHATWPQISPDQQASFSILTILLCKHNILPVTGNVPRDPGAGESGVYNRIAVLRAERGVSRQALADAVGVNYQTIGFLERGDYGPSLKLAFQIAGYFKLPLEAIFSTEPFTPMSAQLYRTAGLETGATEREKQK
jgi:DNA-binding XRE family transcriptional regulator